MASITKENKKVFISVIIFCLFITLGLYIFSNYQNSYSKYNQNRMLLLNQGGFLGQWFSESHQEQWINNPDFNNSIGWTSEYSGDLSDVGTYISGGSASFQVIGASHTTTLISGTPNSSKSPNWHNITNPEIPVYPTHGHRIDQFGCFASHYWAENLGTTTNAYQKTSVHWEKIITTPYNMSDYIINNASLSVLVNATAKAYTGGNTEDKWSWEGVEVYGDAYARFYEGDYIRFYVRLSNLNKDVSFKVAQYQTSTLGQDGSSINGSYDYLNDTFFEANNMNDLIFYLNQVLINGDFQNFIITLGMEFNCEDNQITDLDEFTAAYIKSCNFTISYVKRINQLTSASWKYLGEQINNKGGIVRVTDAKLYYDYKIDKLWSSNLSPNSELKILINDLEHDETIKLSSAGLTFNSAKQNGFEITRLIPPYERINISIQMVLADEFQLSENYTIGIDNVILDISYDLFFQAQLNTLFQTLLLLALITLGGLTFYYVYYRRVLRFPKAVRKLRRFRKTLNKETSPDVKVIDRNKAFKNQYKKDIKPTSNLLGIQSTPKREDRNLTSNKKQLIIIIFLIFGLLFSPILFGTRVTGYKNEIRREGITLTQNTPPEQYQRETRIAQWIQNSQFNTEDRWISLLDGDMSDIGANISGGHANFNVIGNSGITEFSENGLSNNWTRIENEDNIVLPDVIAGGGYGMDDRGWYAYYNWPDNQPQSVKVQWMKNFSMNVNMSDYYITSASLKAWINGTAQATSMDNGGIDRPGDSLVNNPSNELQIATGDFARFFILISDPEASRKFTAIEYQTDDLGKDGPPAITQLNDTLITPINEETLKFFLEEALHSDHQNFAITLGIYIWCEDSGHPGDQDNWQSLVIKNWSLSVSYEKKINQFSTITWKYLGDQIEAGGYEIEITQAILNFDYRINRLWPTSASPNSEMRVLVDNVDYTETLKLGRAETSFTRVSETGFDVTELIPNDKEINVSIQTYLADEFRLSEDITISIDNVILQITYDVFVPVEESYLFPLLFAIAALVASGVTIYIIYYQKVLKYPIPVRKVRKFRKTLMKEETPNKPIKARERAFEDVYQEELKKSSKFIRGTPVNGKLLRDKMLSRINNRTLSPSDEKAD
ncbi:MAG: hypothetical protein ACFFBH_04430 [Promethearchaeota archaeon]